MRRTLTLIAFFLSVAYSFAQLPGAGTTYPVSVDGNKYVVSGFLPIAGKSDADIFANAALWVIDNICPQHHDGIDLLDVNGRKLTVRLVLKSAPGSGLDNNYHCKMSLQVGDGKLVFYLNEILIEPNSGLLKRVTPLERLQPDKKPAHRETMNDFEAAESAVITKLSEFVTSHALQPITHWDQIAKAEAVKGMTEEECKIAFGKPRMVLESGDETQWMYTTTFTLFFRNGKVSSILK